MIAAEDRIAVKPAGKAVRAINHTKLLAAVRNYQRT